jgi:hypothetical protein
MFKQNPNPASANETKAFTDEVMKAKQHIDSTVKKFEEHDAAKSAARSPSKKAAAADSSESEEEI